MEEKKGIWAYVGITLGGILLIIFELTSISNNKRLDNLEKEVNYVEIILDSHTRTLDSLTDSPDTSFFLKSPKDGLMDALLYLEIPHPKIVYAQAILETGWFTSKGCTKDNNLFGLYKGKHHKKYDTWKESVRDYKKFISSKYKPNEDYYMFLKRINYAEDPNYNSKIKQIYKKVF